MRKCIGVDEGWQKKTEALYWHAITEPSPWLWGALSQYAGWHQAHQSSELAPRFPYGHVNQSWCIQCVKVCKGHTMIRQLRQLFFFVFLNKEIKCTYMKISHYSSITKLHLLQSVWLLMIIQMISANSVKCFTHVKIHLFYINWAVQDYSASCQKQCIGQSLHISILY